MTAKEKQGFGLYFLFAFGLAWLCQIYASKMLLNGGNAEQSQMILSASMFCPLAAVLLVQKLFLHQPTGIGWKMHFAGKVKYIVAAWLAPVLFTILGAVLYFIIFSSRLDTTGSYLLASLGGEWTLETLQSELGMTLVWYLIMLVIQSVSYATIINTIFAVGEEAGWRGYMMPRLKEKLGLIKGRILGGIIWGVWHWPLILLIGYEYGTDYLGAPVLGPLVWCVFCVAMNTLLDWLYEKTECVWIPAIAHGAVNAVAAMPTLLTYPADSYYSILGPMPIGLISMLPLLAVAILLNLKQHKKN